MNEIERKTRCYLGDGCYVCHDGYHVVLSTENGIDITNKVFMEPEVYESLKRWYDRTTRAFIETGVWQ